MLVRILQALCYEVVACLILLGSILLVTQIGTNAPMEVSMVIGLLGLTLWSAGTVYAILHGADLIGL
jgi:hypothetical protein